MKRIYRKLMVIDDEQTILFGLKAVLQKAGHQVIAVNDAHNAAEIAIREKPDLVLCDIMMPIMNGYQVQKTLQDNPATADIPFIFLTARTNPTDKSVGLEAGADDYITKPFEPRELIARINSVLNRQEKGRKAGKSEMDETFESFKSEILHNISHELRTPMTQILLSLEMALRDKHQNPADLDWLVQSAFSQSRRLNNIIDDLIYLNNQDTGSPNTLRQEVDPVEYFLEPLKEIRDYYQEKELDTRIEIDPTVSIHAPKRDFKQATMHLVENAFKFAPPKSEIHIEIKRKGVGGFELTVTDQGAGIPEHCHEKVFERFYQRDAGDTRAYNGLGVGLTIARNFARTLGGDVTILNVPTGFSIRMHIAPARITKA